MSVDGRYGRIEINRHINTIELYDIKHDLSLGNIISFSMIPNECPSGVIIVIEGWGIISGDKKILRLTNNQKKEFPFAT